MLLVENLACKGFRVIKSEIRLLGVDDGRFIPRTKGKVIVVGVVFRGPCSVDGVMHTHVAIDGFDATDQISNMINSSPHSKQLRLIMLNGVTVAGFNVVDIRQLNEATGLPVIAVTNNRPDLDSIYVALQNLSKSDERWNLILKAGKIHEINCSGKTLYAVISGVSFADTEKIVQLTSTNGCLPEPLRVAHLFASGITP